MGVPLFLTQQIVNVKWSGAIFIAGDDAGQIWRCDVVDQKDKLMQKVFVIGTEHEGVPPGECHCASAALRNVGDDKVPTILVGGHQHAFDRVDDDGEEFGHYTEGRIAYSEDGRNWTTVLDLATTLVEPTTVLKIIWDKNANQFYSLALRGITDDPQAECWSSADGKNWSRISSEPGGSNATFELHCKYEDSAGGALADGEFGIDPGKKDSTETFPYGKVVADGLLITTEDMENSPVTFYGGIWGRADFSTAGVLEISTNSGTTWKVAGHIDNDVEFSDGAIRALIAAPKKSTSAGL